MVKRRYDLSTSVFPVKLEQGFYIKDKIIFNIFNILL